MAFFHKQIEMHLNHKIQYMDTEADLIGYIGMQPYGEYGAVENTGEDFKSIKLFITLRLMIDIAQHRILCS